LEIKPLESAADPVTPSFHLVRYRFPSQSERRALERLSLLDLEGARPALREISRTMDGLSRSELKVACLYSFDFLSSVNRILWRGPTEERRRTENREALVRTFSRISRSAELRRVFEEALASILAPLQRTHASRHPAIHRAKAFIQESYRRKISLREVAAHLGLSRTYLSTLFRKECECTLTGYLHRVRLQRAEELIRNGAPALSTVASAVGYQNYRDFHRNFVRYQNVSPNRFKRNLTLAGGTPDPPAEQV